MKAVKLIITLSALLVAMTARAQQTQRLDSLLNQALREYPSGRAKEWIRQLGKENTRLAANTAWPQLSVTGQATYQSEVTKFDFPGIEGPKPYNYNAGLDLRFPLTEFDLVKTRKQLEEEKTNLGLHQQDAELQQLKERVTTLYGNILLRQENKKILALRRAVLDSQRHKTETAVKNGAVLKSNLLVLESEILSTDQQLDDIDAGLNAMTGELSLLCNRTIAASDTFTLPGVVETDSKLNRPELEGFQSRKKLLNLQDNMLKQQTRPQVFLFGQGLYGRPGYNFLNNNMRLYGIAGLGLNWSINNAANRKLRSQGLAGERKLVEEQEKTFRLNLETALLYKQAEIGKYKPIIEKDREIVNKRREILRAASSQLENGVITSTEYVTELNAENLAELNLVLHQVQEAMARIQYNTIAGN